MALIEIFWLGFCSKTGMTKNSWFVLFLFFTISGVSAQQLTLKKGTVLDSIPINEPGEGTFSLFLPTSFDVNKNWPVVTVLDLKGG